MTTRPAPGRRDTEVIDLAEARAQRKPAPPTKELAIEGYDQLAASQIIGLLSGLKATELEAILAHERANRCRRTVISRVTAILADGPS